MIQFSCETRSNPYRFFYVFFLLGTMFLFSGCKAKHQSIVWQDLHPTCGDLVAQLDAAIVSEHVRDVQNKRIHGFPMLRTNRFWSSYAHELETEKEAPFWLTQLESQALMDWSIEKKNLLPASQEKLDLWTQKYFHQNVDEALQQCMQQTHAFRLKHLPDIVAASKVPDDYQTWKRVVGLYPLTAVPFLMGVHAWQDDAKASFQEPLVADESDLHYHMKVTEGAALEHPINTKGQGKNPLNIPIPDDSEMKHLFEHFAPQLTILAATDVDHLGEIKINSAQQSIHVKNPVVYTHISHTRWHGKALLQLNYMFWFSARPKTSVFDLLGGELDGLIWRVTLTEDGRPLLYDAIHPCGCYHMFFPSQSLSLKEKEDFYEEGALVPQFIPNSFGDHLELVIKSQTHSLLRIQKAGSNKGVPYQQRPYHALRSIPYAEGFKSMFDEDGLVAGSERGERFFFWPMGIESAGAMRQWGHHATEFVGERHFDDANLIDRYFK